MKNNIFLVIIFLLSGCCNPYHHNEIRLVETKYPNGAVKEKGATIDGKKVGYWITYDTLRNIKVEKVYFDNRLNGPIKFYYENGNIKREGQIKNDSIFYGQWKNYFFNGQLEAKGIFVNSEMDSIWEFYSEDGRLDRKVEYHNDKKVKVLIDNKLSPPIPGER